MIDMARKQLSACGARPRRIPRTGMDSLTPTERRIAELAADGLSNPQIAQDQFISRKTVESHLLSAFRKLAISSREDLVGALQRSSPDEFSGRLPDAR